MPTADLTPTPAAVLEAARVVSEWLTEHADRWERALDADPVDVAGLRGMPLLPGRATYADAITVVRGAALDLLTPRPEPVADDSDRAARYRAVLMDVLDDVATLVPLAPSHWPALAGIYYAVENAAGSDPDTVPLPPAPAHPTPAGEFDLGAVKGRLAAARAMVSALCQPRNADGAREWIMSIPARPDHDPDLVIGAALRDLAACVAEIERLRGAVADLRHALDNADHAGWCCVRVNGTPETACNCGLTAAKGGTNAR